MAGGTRCFWPVTVSHLFLAHRHLLPGDWCALVGSNGLYEGKYHHRAATCTSKDFILLLSLPPPSLPPLLLSTPFLHLPLSRSPPLHHCIFHLPPPSLTHSFHSSLHLPLLSSPNSLSVLRSLSSLHFIRTIYEKLGGAVSEEQRTLYSQRVEEISPNVRYCAYNMGDTQTDITQLIKLTSDTPGYDLLASKIDVRPSKLSTEYSRNSGWSQCTVNVFTARVYTTFVRSSVAVAPCRFL